MLIERGRSIVRTRTGDSLKLEMIPLAAMNYSDCQLLWPFEVGEWADPDVPHGHANLQASEL